MRSPTPLLVLLNPHAGGVRASDPTDLSRALEAEGVPAEVEAVDPAELVGRIEREKGHRSVIGVAGGDGSHAAAARALLGSDTALAPIPTGRLNHFARRARMATVAEAAAAIRARHRISISVGRLDERVFLDTAVIGAYGDFVDVRERLRPWLTTWPAAAVSGLLLLARWPRVQVSVRTPASERDTRSVMVWVGVGRNSFPEPHEAPLAGDVDATLQLVILRGGRRSAAQLLVSLMRYRRWGHRGLEGDRLEVDHPPWIEVRSPAPVSLVLDGEAQVVEPPVRLALEPKALWLIIPRQPGP